LDKNEYNIRMDEIKSLIAKRDFVKAVEVADTIDWTRVRSVSTLCTISDLYKINRRYNDAKELLLRAYEKYPGGRTIVYSLCELCLKTDDIIGATEYYKEFVQLAPTDNGKFVLQYKIYEATDVTLEERIAVLEELKKREYREKWGYELAYLYHRIGLATKCVEECDELILWFREGKYVKKAMELKQLHQQLTSEQEMLYNQMHPKAETPVVEQETKVYVPIEEKKPEDIQVKTVDVSKYNTINLQKVLADSMKEVMTAEQGMEPVEELAPMSVTQQIMSPMMQNTGSMQELFFEDTEPEEEPQEDASVEESVEYEQADYVDEAAVESDQTDYTEEPDVMVEQDTTEVEILAAIAEEEAFASSKDAITIEGDDYDEPAISERNSFTEEEAKLIVEAAKGPIANLIKEQVAEAVESVIREERPVVQEQKKAPDFSKVEPPSSMGRLLSQEYDGQISLVVPENEHVEKQITGQLNLEDILAEWEKTKKENEDKRKEEVKQRVLQQTGAMFTEFDMMTRDGILEKLEKGSIKPEELPEVEELAEIEENTQEDLDEPVAEETAVEVQDESVSEAMEEELDVFEEEDTSEDLTEEESEENVIEEQEEAAQAESAEETEATEEAETEADMRSMSEEEVALFAPFVQTKGARVRLMQSLDKISLAGYTGNVFVTGEHDEAIELAKNVLKEVQLTDGNFSGKVAKVNGQALNNKDVDATVSKLKNGGLIIERAAGMNAQTTKDLLKALNQEGSGIVVVLQDTKKNMHRMMEYFDGMKEIFNVHIEVEELGDEALVAYGKKYARHMEYAIDEMGILALHRRIDEMQTSDHVVTVADVRDIVDEAIENANKKNLRHFRDILFAKRYDEEDMIILRERDF